jgi:hypothetical protein
MRLLLLLVLILTSGTSFGWNDHGHMIIAAIAYQQMADEEQAKVTEILKHHPAYAGQWKPNYHNLNQKVDLGLYLFMQASVWADEIRDQKHPQHHHDAPKWHYLNYELRFPYDGSTQIVDPDNVLKAIASCQKRYHSAATSFREKSIALCWLLHLVGDLHQPLHSVSLYSDQYPDGDKGGNRFWVKDRGSVRLHAYWDGLLGRSAKVKDVLNDAAWLTSEILPPGNESSDSELWSLESFQIAREKVYLNGKLSGGSHKESARQVPQDYGKNSRQTGRRRVVAAGYRLAHML